MQRVSLSALNVFVILINISDAKIHRQTVLDRMKIFKCKECGKCFTLRIKLNAHRNRVHRELLHKRTTTDNKPTKSFQCQECGESFAFKNLLLKHKITHTRSECNDDPTFEADVEGHAKKKKMNEM